MTQIQTEAEQLYPDSKNFPSHITSALRSGYKRGANRNAWISVDVQPDDGTEWLCWDKANEMILVCLFTKSEFKSVWQDDDFDIRDISHYQALPLQPTL